MSRLALFLVLTSSLAACGPDEPDELAPVTFDLSEVELSAIDAALDTARAVAADSALAYVARGPEPVEIERNWPASDDLVYVAYLNDRHGYLLDYPDNLFQRDDGLDAEHGQSFSTNDGTAALLVYASPGGEGALERQYESELASADQRITYQVLRPNWFVVSGYEGPYIFYRRTLRSGDGLRTFRLRHLAEDRAYFDAVTERLSHSFEG